jgi:predicted amidohydrolase YtcJ
MRTLLTRARVLTPDAGPGGGPTSMVVDGDTIAWVGTGDPPGPVDATEDLGGALVTPAVVDAHVHATSTGTALAGLDLTGCRSLAACLAAVEAAARAARGGIVLGHGWDETTWPEHRPPTRQELDRASYGGVVYLTRIDVHSAVVSSALLAAAPEARSAQGYADSGHVATEAHHVVRRVGRDAVTPGQRRAAQRATRARAAQLGVGTLHELGGPDISSPDDFRALLALADEEPGPDVVGYWGELGGVAAARELAALGAAGDLFADGAIGSHTACLRAPYADADSTGHAYLSAAQVRDHVVACTDAGLQAGFHAIGDGALEAVVAGLREAAERVGADALRAARHRLEHVEMVDREMIATLAELGVVASVQPAFDRLWGGPDGMYAERLGLPRGTSLNPFADLAAAGVVLALGSDSPVTPIDPWGTVRAAVRHRTPGQGLRPEAAFAAHTQGGWYAAKVDGAGVLHAGAAATYAVWDTGANTAPGLPPLGADDPLPTCLRTVVRGRTIFAGPADHHVR